MSYYGDLWSRNVVDWLKPLIDNGTYKPRLSDGKFELGRLAETTSSPWHYIQSVPGSKCVYLHNQLFSVISSRTPIGKFVPRRCHSCWKIVIRPKSVKQLFALERLLIETRWPCKCGIERRAHTPLSKYRYGGYVYNVSTEEGLDRLDKLRGLLDADDELKDVECYLKRACTEMELAFPDTPKWEVSEEQNRIEDLLEWAVIHDVPTNKVSSHILDNIHMRWIEWAAENGDETYLEYTGGKRLYPEAVRYERKVEGADEVTPDDETVSVGESSPAVPKGNTRRKTKGKKK